MSVFMNQNRYPDFEYNLSFPNQQFSRAYRDAAMFSEKFYGMNELITQSNITPADYKDLYPLLVFDVSKQSEHPDHSFLRCCSARRNGCLRRRYLRQIANLSTDGNQMFVMYK